MTWYAGYLQGFQEGYLKALEQQMQIREQQNALAVEQEQVDEHNKKIITQLNAKHGKKKYVRSPEGEKRRVEAVRKYWKKK